MDPRELDRLAVKAIQAESLEQSMHLNHTTYGQQTRRQKSRDRWVGGWVARSRLFMHVLPVKLVRLFLPAPAVVK